MMRSVKSLAWGIVVSVCSLLLLGMEFTIEESRREKTARELTAEPASLIEYEVRNEAVRVEQRFLSRTIKVAKREPPFLVKSNRACQAVVEVDRAALKNAFSNAPRGQYYFEKNVSNSLEMQRVVRRDFDAFSVVKKSIIHLTNLQLSLTDPGVNGRGATYTLPITDATHFTLEVRSSTLILGVKITNAAFITITNTVLEELTVKSSNWIVLNHVVIRGTAKFDSTSNVLITNSRIRGALSFTNGGNIILNNTVFGERFALDSLHGPTTATGVAFKGGLSITNTPLVLIDSCVITGPEAMFTSSPVFITNTTVQPTLKLLQSKAAIVAHSNVSEVAVEGTPAMFDKTTHAARFSAVESHGVVLSRGVFHQGAVLDPSCTCAEVAHCDVTGPECVEQSEDSDGTTVTDTSCVERKKKKNATLPVPLQRDAAEKHYFDY